ncbi:MAG: RsmB/NOP family class I SAM-dependent RNA methyltransferase [Desulfovermiculus sp.]|nr:RsmB/NOP family class I SAM-dependent RNA methyltransferase [Desulfovermiculus sp.]
MRHNHLSSPQSRLRTFRLVCRPYERLAVESLLAAEGYVFEPEPYLASARCLTFEPKPLGASAAAVFGLIYILDKSSMLPPLSLDLQDGDTVLDLCASPGSKTGVLAELVGEAGLVVANEPNKKRYQTLRQNMRLANLLQVVTTGYKAEAYPGPRLWDKILLDVPCSGWGTAEKNPQVLSLWRENTIKPLISLQQSLLSRAAALLASGGLLIYSTCTTNVQENENQVLWAAEEFGLQVEALSPWPGFVFDPPQSSLTQGTLRVNGPASQGQSFFVAGLRKPGWKSDSGPGDYDSERVVVDPDVRSRLKAEVDWQVLPPGRVEMEKERLLFKPQPAVHDLAHISWQGTVLGHGRKGLRLSPRARRLVPQPEHGQALVLDSIDELHRLLQGQSLSAPGPGPLAGLYWEDLPLGWVTIKGKRCMWTDR